MKRVLALFPGMAAITPGSGRTLPSTPAVRASLAELTAASGMDVAYLLGAASPAELRADRAWELAAVAAEMAAVAAHRNAGGRVDGTLGFSIGAYAALAGAGVVSTPQVVTMIDLVLEASRRLAGPFAMVAVLGLPAEAVAAMCRRGEVELAATLTAAQHLVAGSRGGVEAFVARARGDALRLKELDVRWPLHTSLMEPVAAHLNACRDRVGELAEPSVPVYSALHGRVVRGGAEVWELLVGHLHRPQRFADALRQAVTDGFDALVELGPGETLTRTARWVVRDRVDLLPSPFAGTTDAPEIAC